MKLTALGFIAVLCGGLLVMPLLVQPAPPLATLRVLFAPDAVNPGG
jgi:hypothetical protein